MGELEALQAVTRLRLLAHHVQDRVHKLGSLDSVDEKIQLLKRLLAIPSSSINEHDVITILAAETEDLVSSVVKVSDIYTAEKTKETLQLLTLTLKFFNRVLGIVITL